MEQTLGKRIVFHRKRLNLTQDRLAELMGVTAQAVSKWENDQSCPDIAMLPKLAGLFGISTDELLGMEPREEPAREAEVVVETPPHMEDDGAHTWEFHWDGGRKSGIGFAVLALLVGGLLLAGALLSWNLSFWSILWPSALLVFGVFGLYPRFSFLHISCTLVGAYFLAEELGILPFYLGKNILLPVALLVLGISLLADALRRSKKPRVRIHHPGKMGGRGEFTSHCTLDGEAFDCSTSFGEKSEYISLPRLSGGDISVSFGELTVDLRGCETVSKDCTLDASCSFGELRILVPARYRVEPNASTAFASVEVHGDPDPEPQSRIRLNCSANFGEIEIRYI